MSKQTRTEELAKNLMKCWRSTNDHEGLIVEYLRTYGEEVRKKAAQKCDGYGMCGGWIKEDIERMELP